MAETGSPLTFDLRVVRTGETYRVRLMDGPWGQSEAEFVPPVGRVDVDDLVAGSRSLTGFARDVVGSAAPRLHPAAMAELGLRLFDALFVGPLLDAYRRAISGDEVRFRLDLTEAPALVDLPWELLYDGQLDRFVAASNRTPLVRTLRVPPVPPRPAERPPLRMLVVVSGPTDRPLLDAATEWGRLTQAAGALVADGRLAIHRIDDATPESVRASLGSVRPHVLHYVGHGGYDPDAQQGTLVLEGPNGLGRSLRAEEFADLVSEAEDLRLVVLNSCEGSRSPMVDPFAGTAQALLGLGVPAVVGMQFEVSDDAAIGFARGFYGALCGGAPVEDAVAEGRLAMMTEGDGSEWATPSS